MITQRFIVRANGSESEVDRILRHATAGLPGMRAPRIIGRREHRKLVRFEAGFNKLAAQLPVFLERVRTAGLPAVIDRRMRPAGILKHPGHAGPGRPDAFRHKFETKASGVGIAVLDVDGIAPHPTFENRLETFVLENDAFVPGVHPAVLGAGHGTAVASVAAGNSVLGSPAPDSLVFGYRCGFVWDVMKAIDHVLSHVPAVCLIATACHFPKDPTTHLSDQDHFESTIQSARDAGVIMLAAAGNTGPAEGVLDPAVFASVRAVGGFDNSGSLIAEADANDYVALQSARGRLGQRKPDFLQFFGPYDYADSGGGYSNGYGTSLAVGRAAGAIATIYGKRGGRTRVTPSEVDQLVESSCLSLVDEFGSPYGANVQGSGALSEAGLEAQL